MGTVVRREGCPACGSSDAFTRYEDGGAYCFSANCGHTEKPTNIPTTTCVSKTKSKTSFATGEADRIVNRKLSLATCERWKYHKGVYGKEESPCHIANFLDDRGQVIGQKLRFKDKHFLSVGDISSLYGKHLYPSGGKYAVITEGELDALSITEALGKTGNYICPMSLPSGSSSASKVIPKDLAWLEESFERIILLFDNDDAGKAAQDAVVNLFSPGKCYVAKISEKDASDMLVSGKSKELIDAIFNAKEYKPSSILRGDEIWDIVNTPNVKGEDLPWSRLSKATYGVRPHEIWAFSAGTSVGKSELFKEWAYHFAVTKNIPIGVFFLEENEKLTSLCMMSKHLNVRLQKPDVVVGEAEKRAAFKATLGTNNINIFKHGGNSSTKDILTAMRYMIKAYKCKYIFLDHITLMATGADGGSNDKVHGIMKDLRSIAESDEVTIFLISHIRKSDKVPAEEGATIRIDDLYGSSGIKQICDFLMVIERDINDTSKGTTLRILKDRFTGESTGRIFELNYNTETGRLTEQSCFKAIEDVLK